MTRLVMRAVGRLEYEGTLAVVLPWNEVIEYVGGI